MHFRFELENISSRPVEFCHSYFRVMILDSNRRVFWVSDWNEITVPSCTHLELEPGEKWTRELVWDQSKIGKEGLKNTTDGNIAPGRYLAVGTFAQESATQHLEILN